MQKLERRKRVALKWGALFFALFWIAVIAFRISLMASDAPARWSFT
ncbi:hypothetical protein [Sphingomonas sp. R1]|jgi:hypothetical protein|nr:hypothetical protein [Sphingomonas sp. R1]UYY75903.1 hypothetical protein OIM94_10180 [Sphingomonas sp. R1]